MHGDVSGHYNCVCGDGEYMLVVSIAVCVCGREESL